MEERLASTKKDDLQVMSAMVFYMVYHCPDNDKIYLEVSHRVKWSPLDCQLDVDWTKPFIRISEAVGALEVGYHLRSTPWPCSRTCSEPGEITEGKGRGCCR